MNFLKVYLPVNALVSPQKYLVVFMDILFKHLMYFMWILLTKDASPPFTEVEIWSCPLSNPL